MGPSWVGEAILGRCTSRGRATVHLHSHAGTLATRAPLPLEFPSLLPVPLFFPSLSRPISNLHSLRHLPNTLTPVPPTKHLPTPLPFHPPTHKPRNPLPLYHPPGPRHHHRHPQRINATRFAVPATRLCAAARAGRALCEVRCDVGRR